MDLVGSGKVFIGRRDDRTVGILQTIQPVFKALHGNSAKVNNV